MDGYGGGERRDRRRYRRAARRAFATVTFYREQWAVAGRVLAEPVPTPADALPDPPHTLCPFARPWTPDREPSLWTPSLRALGRALRMAGCHERLPVLEVREALLDQIRIRRHPLQPRPDYPAYRVLLSPTSIVASPARRAELDQEALHAAAAGGGGWLVGGPPELAAVPELAGVRLRPVHRLPVAATADHPATDVPTVLHEPRLGYLGAFVPECRRFHLDGRRVYARDRAGTVALSLPYSRRPTLLDIVPPGAERVTVGRCERHRTPVLRAR